MKNQSVENSVKKINRGDGDWRIAYIPCGEECKPICNLGPLLGMIVFLAGVWFLVQFSQSKHVPVFFDHRVDTKTVLMMMAGGWVFALASLWWSGRTQRKTWVKIKAKCLDKEWQRVFSGEGYSWTFRLLCKFYFNGKEYQVTPAPYWTTFISENSLKQFLERKITVDHYCDLYINPKNPLQAEVVGRDVKDFLLH